MKTRPQSESRGPLLTGTILSLLLSAAGTIQAAEPVTRTAKGDLLLADAEGRSFVHQPGGQRVELPLSKAARITDFRSTDQDWLAAAVSQAGGEPRLELLRGRGTDVETLPAPAIEPVAQLAQPKFVADGQGVRALVWFAGDAHHQHAVQASSWHSGGWGATETISPPGKGTQIALSTAVLDDGTWLVVWAAFDGRDDEILWSRFADGVWSKPRPIAEDNAVPDITPHLFATPGGALVAWSRYDGNDYRVNVARFDGERWSAPNVAGPAGSTAPIFSAADQPYLIYRHAVPAAWAVMQLDTGGEVLREATLPLADPQRPVLASVSDQSVTFEWLDRERQLTSASQAWVGR